jgi:hypothetical protein
MRNDEERPITLTDVFQLAHELGVHIVFSLGQGSFDLDTPRDALFHLHGTYEQSQAGREAAYSSLRRYRQNLRSSTRMSQQEN